MSYERWLHFRLRRFLKSSYDSRGPQFLQFIFDIDLVDDCAVPLFESLRSGRAELVDKHPADSSFNLREFLVECSADLHSPDLRLRFLVVAVVLMRASFLFDGQNSDLIDEAVFLIPVLLHCGEIRISLALDVWRLSRLMVDCSYPALINDSRINSGVSALIFDSLVLRVMLSITIFGRLSKFDRDQIDLIAADRRFGFAVDSCYSGPKEGAFAVSCELLGLDPSWSASFDVLLEIISASSVQSSDLERVLGLLSGARTRYPA